MRDLSRETRLRLARERVSDRLRSLRDLVFLFPNYDVERLSRKREILTDRLGRLGVAWHKTVATRKTGQNYR